ncbi:MAG: DinB family protein [bacterium]
MRRSFARRYCPACKAVVTTPADPVAAMRAFPAALRRVIATLSARERAFRPRAGEWSPRELVAHLADTEIAFGWRLRMVLAHDRPTLAPFDENALATALNHSSYKPKPTLELFSVLRRANCDLLKAATPGQWKRMGRHPDRGETTVRQLADHRAHHDLNHLAKLRDKLRRIRLQEFQSR